MKKNTIVLSCPNASNMFMYHSMTVQVTVMEKMPIHLSANPFSLLRVHVSTNIERHSFHLILD